MMSIFNSDPEFSREPRSTKLAGFLRVIGRIAKLGCLFIVVVVALLAAWWIFAVMPNFYVWSVAANNKSNGFGYSIKRPLIMNRDFALKVYRGSISKHIYYRERFDELQEQWLCEDRVVFLQINSTSIDSVNMPHRHWLIYDFEQEKLLEGDIAIGDGRMELSEKAKAAFAALKANATSLEHGCK